MISFSVKWTNFMDRKYCIRIDCAYTIFFINNSTKQTFLNGFWRYDDDGWDIAFLLVIFNFKWIFIIINFNFWWLFVVINWFGETFSYKNNLKKRSDCEISALCKKKWPCTLPDNPSGWLLTLFRKNYSSFSFATSSWCTSAKFERSNAKQSRKKNITVTTNRWTRIATGFTNRWRSSCVTL